MTDLNEKARKFIRELRYKRKIGCNELDIHIFGFKNGFTSKFENGKKDITLTTLSKYADALNFNLIFNNE